MFKHKRRSHFHILLSSEKDHTAIKNFKHLCSNTSSCIPRQRNERYEPLQLSSPSPPSLSDANPPLNYAEGYSFWNSRPPVPFSRYSQQRGRRCGSRWAAALPQTRSRGAPVPPGAAPALPSLLRQSTGQPPVPPSRPHTPRTPNFFN